MSLKIKIIYGASILIGTILSVVLYLNIQNRNISDFKNNKEGDSIFSYLDSNHNGYISPEELNKSDFSVSNPKTGIYISSNKKSEKNTFLFDNLDTNHDGLISRREFLLHK